MPDKREERIKKFTTAELFPLIVRMAIPSMIGMLVATIYNMTDTFWVGKPGSEACTASVGVVFSFTSVIQAIGFWFGYGSGNYISRMLGKKNYEKAEKMAAVGVSIALLVSVVIVAAGLIFINPLIEILGGASSQELFEATKGYLLITICSVPFMGYYILSGMMLQNIGRFGLATSVTVAENGTVFIPTLLIFSYLWQVNGIIFSKPAASVAALIYSFVIGTYAFRKYLCMEGRTEDEVLKSI